VVAEKLFTTLQLRGVDAQAILALPSVQAYTTFRTTAFL